MRSCVECKIFCVLVFNISCFNEDTRIERKGLETFSFFIFLAFCIDFVRGPGQKAMFLMMKDENLETYETRCTINGRCSTENATPRCYGIRPMFVSLTVCVCYHDEMQSWNVHVLG